MTTTIVHRCTPVDLKLRVCHVRHDSFMHVTRLIHLCHVTRLYTWQYLCTWRDFFVYVTRLFRVCDMTHSYMWQQGPCFCLSSLLMAFMCTYDMTWLLHVWHNSFMRDMTPSYVTWLLHVQKNTLHTSNTTPYRQSTATLTPQHDLFTRDMTASYGTWLLHVQHKTLHTSNTTPYRQSTATLAPQHVFFGRDITPSYVPWLLHVCHDLIICDKCFDTSSHTREWGMSFFFDFVCVHSCVILHGWTSHVT